MEEISNKVEPTIQPDDLLSISVTSLNPEANILFNRGEMLPTGNKALLNSANNSSNNHLEGYLVDKEGFVDFPVLGKLKIGGLTKLEAKEMIKNELEEYLKEPIINIRFLNYRVTVVGEVNRPSTFTIPSERVNILEALGMAGDMTIYGQRENILVIREENGVRKITSLNLNNKDVLSSPYFYLQQNDVVYVKPHRMREVQAGTDTRYFAVASALASVLIVALNTILNR